MLKQGLLLNVVLVSSGHTKKRQDDGIDDGSVYASWLVAIHLSHHRVYDGTNVHFPNCLKHRQHRWKKSANEQMENHSIDNTVYRNCLSH